MHFNFTPDLRILTKEYYVASWSGLTTSFGFSPSMPPSSDLLTESSKTPDTFSFCSLRISCTKWLSAPSWVCMKSWMSCHAISWVRIAVFSLLFLQQESKLGNSTSRREGWEKYWKGRFASCCRTEGWLPDCTIAWLSGFPAVKYPTKIITRFSKPVSLWCWQYHRR